MNPVEEAKKMMSEYERIEHLQNYHGEDEVVYSLDMRKEIAERKNNIPSMSFVSGIPTLDSLIKSFQGGELTVISGKTKHGKTLLAQTFTRNMNEIILPMWFTYEVRIEQFLSQFGNSLPCFLVPKKLRQNDMAWLEDRIVEGILKYNCQVVFLDNTHNILNLTGDNLTHKIDEFVKRLKEIAVQNNIHIFLMHHVSKCEISSVENLNSNLLRDSSMIPQTADNVFFIWRDKDDKGAWLKITENRREGVFNKLVRLQKVGYFFEESTEISAPVEVKPKTRRRRDIDD